MHYLNNNTRVSYDSAVCEEVTMSPADRQTDTQTTAATDYIYTVSASNT